jgi:hypothetical protein
MRLAWFARCLVWISARTLSGQKFCAGFLSPSWIPGLYNDQAMTISIHITVPNDPVTLPLDAVWTEIVTASLNKFSTKWWTYEGELVNRSQIDIKLKTWYLNPDKKLYFSTYPPPTLIYMSHCFNSALRPAAWESLLLEILQGDLVEHHLEVSGVFERISLPSFKQFYMTNTAHCKQETFLH